ncbi:uncharacterized protein LOC132804484 [Ziziphus jujuba]|uniref:Uncharacterized protein LOC132804484 n=1 Tax=Ziziphus jujuba TaxID=326968 RepID=A0ABM4ADR4_ZIZJJ|nr:uncharacterized protein LOC132804484 [Ziziphus jujuba]
MKTSWSLFACYGTSYIGGKKAFGENFGQVVASNKSPWLICGDRNEVVDVSEKQGGRGIWKRRLFLKEFMENVGGIDLGFNGERYTWTNGQTDQAAVKERLDRAIANKDWLEANPLAFVEYLNFEESNHCPFVIRSEGAKNKCNRTFGFFKAWTDQTSYKVVKKA